MSNNKAFIDAAKDLLTVNDDVVTALLVKIIDKELDGVKIISSTPTSSWGDTTEVVFKLDKQFFKFQYDHASWSENGTLGECFHPNVKEVFPVEKMTIVYE